MNGKRFINFIKNNKTIIDESITSDIIKLETKEIKKSIPIINNIKVLKFLISLPMKPICLSSKLVKEFTELFGSRNTTFRDEFFYSLWIVSFKGEEFNIYSSNRGTSYEIVDNNSEDKTNVCIRFLTKLKELLYNNLKM